MKKRLTILGIALGLSVAGSMTTCAEYYRNENGGLEMGLSTYRICEREAGTWVEDSKGWRIQYTNGLFLADSWYQSPTSGLYYYMNDEGYMLTDTITPDGYTVDANGVWLESVGIQQRTEVEQTKESIPTQDEQVVKEKEVLKEQYLKYVYPRRSEKSWASYVEGWKILANAKLSNIGVGTDEIQNYINDILSATFDVSSSLEQMNDTEEFWNEINSVMPTEELEALYQGGSNYGNIH